MSHFLIFLAGACVGLFIMAILAAGRDTETSMEQGPMTPPADPNDPAIEIHGV